MKKRELTIEEMQRGEIQKLQNDLHSLAREVAFHKGAFEDKIRRASRVKWELREKKGFPQDIF